MGTHIISKTHAPRNGRTLADAFAEAFIPTNDNRIMVTTQRVFWLGKYYVPAGSVGKVVDLVCDGRLMLVDFGLSVVARFPVGSNLIEFVAEGVQRES